MEDHSTTRPPGRIPPHPRTREEPQCPTTARPPARHTGQPPAEFLQLDPATLLTDHNIRAVRTDDAFRTRLHALACR
jgi:hypothetical protein